MTEETKKPEDKKEAEKPELKSGVEPDGAERLSSEGWSKSRDNKNIPESPLSGRDEAARLKLEKGNPFAGAEDSELRSILRKFSDLNQKSGAADAGQLRKFESFLSHINGMIKDANTASPTKTAEIDTPRFGRVLDAVERYQKNQDALKEALAGNNQAEIERLSREQEEIKKQMESAAFRKDMEAASHDLTRAYNVLRGNLGTTYDGMLKTLVDFGRKIPLEALPQDLPSGLKGFAISNEQFAGLVGQGQLKLPEKKLGDFELPTAADLREINKILRFTDAASQEINRGMLEQQFALAKSRLGQLDASGELAKKWFPEKVETLTDAEIEKRLAAATPWIQKGLEVQRYAELHHRFQKMINEQFTWPSWMGGIPSNWDASAIEKHKDIVAVSKDEKTGRVSISVKLPETLDRDDANTDRIRQMDEWLSRYKKPVDQVMGQIDASKADNNIVYWGDIKTEMRVDKDGNMVEKGWKDAQGRQVFQESDGRKYRSSEQGAKEWVPLSEKLQDAEFRIVNGKTVWVQPGELISDVNLMSFRTEAKEVKGDKGEPLIEIKQVQNLQYAHWASYQGWGWVSDVKTMGADIKAEKIDKDMTIAADKGAVGGRREGKSGDYLVTLSDGRQQFVDAKSFEKLYRPKEGKAGEFEEKPKLYKPDEWVVVYRTDSGIPQPTLMQAKDVPAFCSSQAKWHYGTKVVTTAVDAIMLVSGVAEVRAAMVGVEAAAGTAAKLTTAQVLGKALLTHQGAFGALHAGFGVTGFMGQGIENLGPYGKTFMHVRAMAMIADLGYTAIGRPLSPAPFAPAAEQIAGQGFLSRSLLNFNRAFNEASMTQVLRLDRAGEYLGRMQALQRIGQVLSPVAAVGRIPGLGKVGEFLTNASFGRMQSLGADVFFLSDIGFRQIPGIVNRARGTDSQQVQQQQAMERRWAQSTLADDRKTPSSFDKQSLLKIEAYRAATDDALKLKEDDPKRVELNRKLIETVKSEKADAKDRLAAAFALVTLNGSDGKLPERIQAAGESIDRETIHKFVDSQRYLQAKEVLAGFNQNLKVHVSDELKAKLDGLKEKSEASFSDDAGKRETAMAELIATFNSASASPEEKFLAASSLLYARRRAADGALADTIKAGNQELKAAELVDFLYRNSQAGQGEGASAVANPAHLRLLAGDMLLRLDIDRFSIADMSQICLSIVNDKNAPADPAAKERWQQLKMQAMVDAHGYRLGDLYELMKSRVEPEIANMPVGDADERERKGMALAALAGRDSDAIRKTLESLRKNEDARVSGLAAYMLYSGGALRPSERQDNLALLHNPESKLAWPQDADRNSQLKWVESAAQELSAKLNAELPASAGEEFDKSSSNKFRAAEELIARNPDLNQNPELQIQINSALMSLVNADNPELAARALPLLLSRIKSYENIFKSLKPEEMNPGLKTLQERLFSEGAILSTLRDNSLDLLKDSSTYASYSTRAQNLAVDLQKLRTAYAQNRENLSETDRAQIEGQIAELSRLAGSAGDAPLALKKALLAGLPDLLGDLSKLSPASAKAYKDAVIELCTVNSTHPETVSPELRAKAIAALSLLETDRNASSALLAGVLKDDPSPLTRMAALEALTKLRPDNLQEICLKQLAQEKHPEIAKALREVEFTNRRPEPDSRESLEKFNKSRLDLINSAARSLSGAEDFLKANNDLKSLDGYTLRAQALDELKDLYFNGVGGFFRFAWEGEKGVDADHAKLLDKYAGKMREAMDSLGSRAKTEDEALKALVYIALSNGRPLLKDDRNWGAEKATEKLKEICRDASPERARQIAWTVEMLLLHQPKLSAAGRQNVLDGLKSLLAKPGQAGLSDAQISTLLASSLQRELRNTPAPGAKDFAAREKLQLDMLSMLDDKRFQSKEILPTLEALSVGAPRFKVNRDAAGEVSKVQYPDGSSREIVRRNGLPVKYIFRDAAEKATVWLPDASKANTWYKEGDTDKKEPWSGRFSFDSASGDYHSFNEKTGIKSIYKAEGGHIDLLGDRVKKITYPDGSSREFDPPGDGYKRFTFTSADGKSKEVWEREGESSRFFKPEDKERKNPWTGAEHIDALSGDYVTVQGQTRTIFKANGARLQLKDGVYSELVPPSSMAYNTSIASVRARAQDMLARLSDRSEVLRQQTRLPENADAEYVSKKILAELANPNAGSERVARSVLLSEKLGPITNDSDPRRAALQVAARDGHEFVRLTAARELAASSNSEDRKLAYSVLSRLEKQGSRKGYVDEAHEILGRIVQDRSTPADDKVHIERLRQDAPKLDAASYRNSDRIGDMQMALDYQDAFERSCRELKDNAMRLRNLSQYEGSANWFSKSEKYNLLDADKIAEAQKQAVLDAYPGPLRWLFMSQASIDKVCDDAVKEVWNRQERQLAALGEEAKLAGESGREAREALASIILTQGQPLRESDRSWAMHAAARMIRDCVKDGHPGAREMLWVVKAALIEEPALDPTTRFYLMNTVQQAKERGILDSKEASIVMAAALESEYQGMPSSTKAPDAYKSSLDNQTYAINLISLWGNVEASPTLQALSSYHPDAGVRQNAGMALEILNIRRESNLRPSAQQLARARTMTQIDRQILELERIRLRLPAGTSAEEIQQALQAEAGKGK